jgi:excisionase family DNA binding protein
VSIQDPTTVLQDHPQGAGHSAPRTATRSDEAKYWTPAEVAELLQVSVKTISRMSLEDGSMLCFRRGRVVRFPRAQLLAWLDRQAQPRRKSR